MESKRNILIAEKLMGWKIYRTTAEWQKAGSPTSRRSTVLDQNPRFEIPDYDGNMLDAWKVYGFLAERGIVRVSNGDGDSKDCDFTPFRSGLKTAHVSATTYPRAICKAALIAMGLE